MSKFFFTKSVSRRASRPLRIYRGGAIFKVFTVSVIYLSDSRKRLYNNLNVQPIQTRFGKELRQACRQRHHFARQMLKNRNCPKFNFHPFDHENQVELSQIHPDCVPLSWTNIHELLRIHGELFLRKILK